MASILSRPQCVKRSNPCHMGSVLFLTSSVNIMAPCFDASSAATILFFEIFTCKFSWRRIWFFGVITEMRAMQAYICSYLKQFSTQRVNQTIKGSMIVTGISWLSHWQPVVLFRSSSYLEYRTKGRCQRLYICSKVNIWYVSCARATAFIFDTWTGALVKVSQFLRQKMSRPEGDSNPQPSDSCRML